MAEREMKFPLNVAERGRNLLSNMPTYGQRLREFITQHSIETLLAGTIVILGTQVLSDEPTRTVLLPRLGQAAAISIALGVAFGAAAAWINGHNRQLTTLQIEGENAEDIERNDILPGIQD